jgi:hypothetical protein
MLKPAPAAKTARHFEEGARIVHNEYGLGTIRNGRPVFDSGTTGTSMTRVRPAEVK